MFDFHKNYLDNRKTEREYIEFNRYDGCGGWWYECEYGNRYPTKSIALPFLRDQKINQILNG